MGDGAVGTSLSLVASGEDKNHTRIVDSLNTRFEEFHLDGRLLAASQERVNLAAKVISAEEIHQKAAKNNRWFKEKAAEAGLEVDDDMLDDGICGGDDVAKQHKRNREAKAAKGQLRRLLAEPMQTQRHGKFLSTNSSLMKRARIDPIVQPDASSGRRNKKRRKQR